MIRVGNALDVHAFADAAERGLILAGVPVPDAPGLAGHSDADVVAHAVAEALLGAAAMGDLGSRFGIDRPETAGADSMRLLADVVGDLAGAGWEVGNVDVTVVAQRPRLASHRDEMRRNLAVRLAVEASEVSVKFTTTDRLGAIGRGEGIAALAVVTIQTR